jgi:hypothetical protein
MQNSVCFMSILSAIQCTASQWKNGCLQQRRPLICEVFKVDGVDGVAVLLDLDNFPLHNQMSGLLTAIRLQVPLLSLP